MTPWWLANLGSLDAMQCGHSFPGSREPDIAPPPPLTEAEREPMTDEEFRRLMPICWRLAQENQ